MIIGSLLASPPDKGELQERIQELADQEWEHPTTGEMTRFSFSTLERWFYKTRGDEPDPFGKLARKTRMDAGKHPTISVELGVAIAEQFRDHPSWQYKLHHDNLLALAAEQSELGLVPSYATVSRYMKDRGMLKQKKRKKPKVALEPREKRSWEVQFPNQLWHLDFHQGSRRVLLSAGRWLNPWLLGILDDHSRLACHLQWYLEENTENLIHGLSQAFQKRDLPRALLTDEPNSDLGGALSYMTERWDKLTLFLRVPDAPLDNNLTERSLKMAIRLRRASLFYATTRGALAGDVFQALICTTLLHGGNALRYLTSLFMHDKHVEAAPHDWLPWNYEAALARLAAESQMLAA